MRALHHPVIACVIALATAVTALSCTHRAADDSANQLTLTPGQLGGIYAAYPEPDTLQLTPAPEGYEPFYISHYGRHGSRYQPNDSRYLNTLQRLQDGHARGVLTPYGEQLLPQIQLLCDSCLGHGGQLSRVGERQLRGIGQRMARTYPALFERCVEARSSVVDRCIASMHAFADGLSSGLGRPLDTDHFIMSADSSDMSVIAYDSPAMRHLNDKQAAWRIAYDDYSRRHVDRTALVQRLFTDAADVDTFQLAVDLYWLAVGMQDIDVPGCDLSGVFTYDELMQCYQCVNYRMYVCNANNPQSQGIPAQSASSLLADIISRADSAIVLVHDTAHDVAPGADLRFGHDSNLLRLLALMHVHGADVVVDSPADAWRAWHEYQLSPMAANLQLVFYRPADPEGDVLVKILLNERETTLDNLSLLPVTGPYYRWSEVRSALLSQLPDVDSQSIGDDTIVVNIQ